MTDITDQDRRDARQWANWASTYSDRSMAKAAARVILATVDAPAPTLADGIRGLPDYTMSGDHCLNDCYAYASTLAEQTKQVERERDQALAEVGHLTAKVEEQCEWNREITNQVASLTNKNTTLPEAAELLTRLGHTLHTPGTTE